VTLSTQSRLPTLLHCLRHLALLACLFALPLVTTIAQAQPQHLAGHVPRAVAASRLLHAASAFTRLNLSIGIPLRNPEELDALLAQITDPSSPNFQHFLTPTQFADQFGPTEQDYQAVIQFAQQNGLTVTGTHPNRAVLSVSGAVADVENAFHLKINTYSHPTRGEFYAPDREPSVPSGIKTLDISGLDNFAPPQPMSLNSQSLNTQSLSAQPFKTQPLTSIPLKVTGSGPGGYLIGKDFRAAYAPSVTLTGAGQTVGLLEFDGFFAGDVTKNFAAAGLTPVPTQTVLLDGISGSAGSANIEVILDIMMAAYMAPGLSKVIVYEGANPNDVLNRMATDNLASQLSSSWGFSGVNATTEQIFKQYIAQGQSLMQASGDSGSYSGGIMAPSDDPNLTVVGGTSVVTQGPTGPWLSESAWSGSGGGVSTTYPIPSWQQSVAMASKGGSTSMRNIPDVALTADIQMYLICNNGQQVSVGGTSAAAPLWAGFLALANQQAATAGKARVGFLNPLIYSIGNSGDYAADMHDITVGSNGGFKALAGYDLTTGWGSPAGQSLINGLTGVSTAASFSISSSTSTVTVHPPTAASSGSATDTLTVTPKNGFSSPVALAVTGLPAGVTAAFTPSTVGTSTAPGSSILTFTAASPAVSGTYPLVVTGVSGKLSATASITLTVVSPSFTLTAAATGLTAIRPAGASTVLTVTGQNSFTGSPAFIASTLPAGVTARFTTATVGSTGKATSTLAFTTSANTPAGSYPVAIKGVSGSLSASTTITLTVLAPSFSLAFAPASINLPRGASAKAAVVITGASGFSGAVAFTAALPAGVTASFGALTSAGVPVTFTASSTASAGAAAVTLTGISSTLSAATKFTLTVLAPAAGTSFVNLSPAYNVNAFDADGLPFTGAGLDGALNGSPTAYSAILLGAQQTIAGTSFYFGPANALDAVSGQTVALAAGQYTSLKLLATAVNGAQLAQSFKVTYTDGTSTTLTQSLSDWFTPSNFPGETKALTMPHRVNAAGQIDNRTFYLYEYNLTLNSAKTVATITFPSTRNVVVLAATLASFNASVR
jgi:hypothetical protein